MAKLDILVVDDEETIRHTLTRFLTSKGATVRAAGAGEEAVGCVRDRAPDVVLLDIVLPGINGVQVLAEIKGISPGTRVIMMTGQASTDAIVAAVGEGADEYIEKPFDHLDMVWSVVDRVSERHNIPAPSELTGPAQPQVLVLDDEESIRHVLTSVLEMNGCVVREAGSTEEALEVIEEWEPAVALVDIMLPGKSGISFLGEIKQIWPDVEALIMTSHASSETAVKAIRLGAYDYLKKPFEIGDVWEVVQRAIERRTLTLKNRAFTKKQADDRERMSKVVSLDQAVQPELDPELLQESLRLVGRELEVEQVNLMLIDAGTGDVGVAACIGPDGPQSERDAAKRVVESGLPRVDATAMSVPLKIAGEIIGVLNVGARRVGAPRYGTDEVAHLTRMAEQLATMIEGARRANQLQAAYESLQAAQQQLVFNERIKAVGQMAAGVAHDFNNVLSVVLARAQLSHRSLERPEPDVALLKRNTEAIVKTALQGAEAIRRIQDYTRIRKDVATTPVDINETIRDAVEIAKPKWKGTLEAQDLEVDIRMELQEIPAVSGNRYELTQVFGNLLFNAVEAMPDGGTLTFRSFVDGESVIVEAEDTGIGMNEETRARLFEPFFTTKGTGQGLGTSILYGIVTRHGGRIDVKSEPQAGTTFRVSLPQSVQRCEVESTVDRLFSEAVRARVLIVDDSDVVRETFRDALAEAGHETAECGSAEEAIEIVSERPFDVVITDMSMDGMSGLDLARWIKSDHPETSVVISSGWAMTVDAPEVRSAGADFVLNKPVMIEDLLGTIQDAARRPVKA